MKKIILDGNSAVANIAYKCSENAFIYPITPSSPMAELVDDMSAKESLNNFNSVCNVTEMQSEAGVAGALHGALLGGSLATTFTSSQGLLLMLPNMFKMAGEMLPAVIHTASRSVATHALNIFCDHSDVMAVRTAGFCMLCSSNVQEAHEFALASHIVAIKLKLPFLHFFDGFRTSHEITNINAFEDEEIKSLYPFKSATLFKENALNWKNPKQYGTAQNPDIFFQNREGTNLEYNNVLNVLETTFKEMEEITKTPHHVFEYYGSDEAENIIVIMGSAFDVVKETIDNLKDKKYGVIKVNLYRPFFSKQFLEIIPKNAKTMLVLDRTKENGCNGEPLYLDVCSTLMENNSKIKVLGGRYGLGGKELTTSMVLAVLQNETKNHFTVGIVDDVSQTSLEILPYNIEDNCEDILFYGLGSDGMVSACKNSAKILGMDLNKYVQAYFEYDSKKSGSLTISHLRVSDNKINKPYLIEKANYIVCGNVKFLQQYSLINKLNKNGTIIINTSCDEENILQHLSSAQQHLIINNNIKIYCIDAFKLAKESGLDNKISSIMETVFLTLFSNNAQITEKIISNIKNAFANKGENVIKYNINAVLNANSHLNTIKINDVISTDIIDTDYQNEYYKNYIKPILKKDGNNLPVSAFTKDGSVPTETTKFEKRNIAKVLPCWKNENCIQCNKCATVCPHGVIRPLALSDEQLKDAPETLKSSKLFKNSLLNFVLNVSPNDCTGCGLCSSVCPAKNKAIILEEKDVIHKTLEKNYEYLKNKKSQKIDNLENSANVQFNKPLFEFSGACAGCGETAYIKLLTQLSGSNLLIANATGCSSIYGGSSPTCPYAKNDYGEGPSWANSLFEDNAEFALGILTAKTTDRNNFINKIKENFNSFNSQEQTFLNEWLSNVNNFKVCEEIYDKLKTLTKNQLLISEIEKIKKPNVWAIGGDGWAYDIGFGGLDHVIASGENIKILVLDTEVYSNTGGQSSKSTPFGTIAKFNSSGKTNFKKNLPLILLNYNNVYVASVCIGANDNQCFNAFNEALKHDGPAIIFAYSPCINHGFNLKESINAQKNAIASGYYFLFRRNPNQNKLVLDSKPNFDLMENRLLLEHRFINLTNNKDLLNKFKENQIKTYYLLKNLAE